MGIYFISTPPPLVQPGDLFLGSRRGTVAHIVRVSEHRDHLRSASGPGQVLMSWCGVGGSIPDLYVDDRTARTRTREKRVCKNCQWRAP